MSGNGEALERELRFTPDDMTLFAAASGDHSPLHCDPAFARRTAFGECIVFGGLETIGMLGLLPDDVLTRVRSVRSSFPGPVLPGAGVQARALHRTGRADEWEIRLTGRGKLLARVVATAGERIPTSPRRAGCAHRAAARGVTIASEEIVGEYRPGDELAQLAERFGAQGLDRRVLEGIAWASRTVGMTIVGFDGLCAAVAVATAGDAARDAATARQRVSICDYDQRTDRLVIEGTLSDGLGRPRCRGSIECFPFSPTPLPAAAALIADGPLAAERGPVVIVGGSRGLGAALALALLAHGHTVHVVYSSCAEAAEELRRLAGPHAARLALHRIDAEESASVSAVAGAIGSPIMGLALCACPPPLAMGLTGDGSGELARYVTRCVGLTSVPLTGFLPLVQRDGGWVLFCSASGSVAADRDLPQFAVAKAAVEGLARWTAETTPAGRVLIARSPRMRTDLANTPGARLAAAAPEAVAAAILEAIAEEDPAPGLEILEPARDEVHA